MKNKYFYLLVLCLSFYCYSFDADKYKQENDRLKKRNAHLSKYISGDSPKARNNRAQIKANKQKIKENNQAIKDIRDAKKTQEENLKSLANAQGSAKQKTDDHGKYLTLVAGVNTTAAAYFGYRYAASKGTDKWALAASMMSASQATATLLQKGSTGRTSAGLSGDLSGFNWDNFTCPKGQQKSCDLLKDFQSLATGGELKVGSADYNKALKDLNKKLSCPNGDCYTFENGAFIAKRTPDKVEIKAADMDNLIADNKKKIQAEMKKFEAKHKPWFDKIAALQKKLDNPVADLEDESESAATNKNTKKFKTERQIAGISQEDIGEDAGSKKRKAYRNLFSQFQTMKKKKKQDAKTVLVGDNQVGISQDNIFLMVHRRYQERRGENNFIENIVEDFKKFLPFAQISS